MAVSQQMTGLGPAAQSPLSSSLPTVPYRLEADEISVPLCLGIDDSPFLLLSLENQAQLFLVLQHLGIWPVWLLSRRKQGRVRALSTLSMGRQWQSWELLPKPLSAQCQATCFLLPH